MRHQKILRQARLAAGLDQKTAARALGWTGAQFLSNIERNLSNLPPEKIVKVCKLYRIDREELAHAMVEDYAEELWRYL